ncbi:MAG TPA: MotA/TolQ/ExbB proton channel family protein [bacterium]|nr:MotA/TolQ/ExbB proton channel family protein [bacterium]
MINAQVSYLASFGSQLILGLLLVASFFVIAFYVERLLFFKKNFNRDINGLIKKLYTAANKTEVENILRSDKSAESAIVEKIVINPKVDSSDKLMATVVSEVEIERKNWERFILYFATVGSNAPFLGLLGTILGLMQSFADLALAEKLDTRVAMAGISYALITTVAGIIVAIPSIVIYNSLSKQVKTASQNTKAIARAVANIIF